MDHDHQLLLQYGVFRRLERYLASTERFHLPGDLDSFVRGTAEFAFKYRHKRLEAGYRMYRARACQSPGRNGYEAFAPSEMNAPPPNLASSGRLNPKGIPFLYAASDPQTAIAEVRPWRGAHLTVATLRLKDSAFVANVRPESPADDALDPKQRSFVKVLDDYFSRPLRAGDEMSYLATQFIAESFSRRGFDGVVFKSSVSDTGGCNLAFFNSDAAHVESTELVEVDNVSYGFKKV